MAILIPIFIGFVVAVISYCWLKVHQIRRKLSWVPATPALPIVGNALELQNTTQVLNVFSKYCSKYDGLCSIELLWQKFIVVSDPEFLEWLLGKWEILDKTEEYKYLGNWLGTGLLTAETDKWRKSRKMLTPSFHFSILENFIDIFDSNANILVELLQKEVDKGSFDIYPYVAMSALDIICETTMGVSINAQKNPKSDYIFAVKEKLRFLIERTYSPIKRFDIFYPLTPEYYKEQKHVKTLHAHTLKIINQRKEDLKSNVKKVETVKNGDDLGIKKRKVFLDLLFEATVDGRPLSDEEIRQEVDTFMFAGHDTTSASLGFTLFCLSRNADVQRKALEEQKNIFQNDLNRPLTHRDLQEMKYLELIIKESLRLYPPVPYTGRRPKKDILYKDGKVIPGGTGIMVMIFVANRNPKYFENPDEFNPDRFEENKNYSQYVYIPFSAGPRNCIGQKYAMLELKAVLSKILRTFELLPSDQDVILSAETVLKSLNGINIKLKKRNEN